MNILVGDMSRVKFEGGDEDDENVGFRSRYGGGGGSAGVRFGRNSNTARHGTRSAELLYILDKWKDTKGFSRVSLQIQIPSGLIPEDVYCRVSTDRYYLVLSYPFSPYFSTAKLEFDSYVMNEKAQCIPEMNVIMTIHPKVIVRGKSWERLLERDVNRLMRVEQRINLGCSVDKKFDGMLRKYSKLQKNNIKYGTKFCIIFI